MRMIFMSLIFEFVWIHFAVADIDFLKPRTTAMPAPIVIAASQDWDGNDGPWSSFPIQLGTPRQTVKVFVGTGAYQTLVVLPEGCTSQDPLNCDTLRGGEFIVNKSTTWQTNKADLSSNIYPLALETRLGLAGRGSYGFDNITLGWQGSDGPTLINQTIGGIATKDFFLGIFGLTPKPTNFTSFNNPIPSYVENLRTSNLIPSTSWSYTAGNQYRFNDVLGSLVLGGYDASKFIPNDLSWSFNSEDSRDITVNVYSITMAISSSTTALLPNTIAAFMDSSVPQIWLPMQACTLFEEAFGITWNETLELYLVNDTQHAENVAQNSTLIFQLGSAMATEFVNITLPYAAFDLTLGSPLVSNSTRYFPLKRASNDSQYTLGRTFFQEAYLTADYERRNFSVSQCSWDINAQESIVAILPPTSSPQTVPSTDHGQPKVPAGVIGGIVAAVILLLFLVAVCFYLIRKRRGRQQVAIAAAAALAVISSADNGKPEMDGQGISLMKSTVDTRTAELQGSDGKPLAISEMESARIEMHETDGTARNEADVGQRQIYEMPAREEVVVEVGGRGASSLEDKAHTASSEG